MLLAWGFLQVKLTDQIAAMRIQYHWRKFLVRRLLRRLVRRDFRRVLDPTTGSYCYWLPDGEYLQRTPYLLGSERWESENMELWSIDEIKKFFRRIGLKEYLKSKGCPLAYPCLYAYTYLTIG